jgi:hypothetical protein
MRRAFRPEDVVNLTTQKFQLVRHHAWRWHGFVRRAGMWHSPPRFYAHQNITLCYAVTTSLYVLLPPSLRKGMDSSERCAAWRLSCVGQRLQPLVDGRP